MLKGHLFSPRTSLVVFVLASSVAAGDLNPPAGAVGPTPGPEPRTAINAANTPGNADCVYRISAPGSYYLTSGVTGQAGKSGIEIAAGNVSIDLMGFVVQGVVGSEDGIVISGDRNSITIRNGCVRGWGGDGVNLTTAGGISGSVGSMVESLRISNQDAATGLRVFSSTIVRDCTITGNLAALTAGGNCLVEGCALADNVFGISVGTDCRVVGTSVRGCTHTGIDADEGSLVQSCTVASCDANGITAAKNGSVLDCVVRDNGYSGISVLGGCLVRGNTCAGNGRLSVSSPGIFVNFAGNRVEQNNCSANAVGIKAQAAGNFIARNTCSANSQQNWNIAASNICLVVQGSATGAAIAGNSGGTAPGSADPNANFTY